MLSCFLSQVVILPGLDCFVVGREVSNIVEGIISNLGSIDRDGCVFASAG